MQVVRLWSDRWGARLLPAVRARARVVRIDLHGTPSECLCYAVGMSDALPGVAIRQAAKQSSRLAAASLSYTLKAGEGARYAEGGGVLFRG